MSGQDTGGDAAGEHGPLRRPAHAAVTAEDRLRVARDPELRRAYRAAFGSPGGIAALRRADEPERTHKDQPSPFAGYELARRQVFAPGATEADREAWRRFAQARSRELDRVDAAVQAALAVVPVAKAAAEPPQVAPAPSRRRRVAVAGVALLIVAGAVIAIASLWTAPRASAPAPSVAAADSAVPPPLAGRTIVVMTDLIGVLQPATGTVYWNSGEHAISAGGDAVAVALRCRGRGRVTVTLSSGDEWPFTCGATTRTFVRVSDSPHTQPFLVFAPTTGAVAWSLRLVTRPVTASTSAREQECGACMPSGAPPSTGATAAG